ncbi:hypothetical protein QBC39DRAFT_250031, partial [Podospora conica]
TYKAIEKIKTLNLKEKVLITVIKYISARGKVVPPYIILFGKELNTRYIRNRLSDKTILNSSFNGYIND